MRHYNAGVKLQNPKFYETYARFLFHLQIQQYMYGTEVEKINNLLEEILWLEAVVDEKIDILRLDTNNKVDKTTTKKDRSHLNVIK